MTGAEIIEAYRNQSERSLEELIDAELDRLECTNERMFKSLHKIKNWMEAYPLTVFPEPDLMRAATVLKDAGMTLDAISASNMRHVLNGIKGYLKKHLFEIRFAIFCIAGLPFTFGTMGIFGLNSIAGENPPAGLLMAHPVLSLIGCASILAVLIFPQKWLEY